MLWRLPIHAPCRSGWPDVDGDLSARASSLAQIVCQSEIGKRELGADYRAQIAVFHQFCYLTQYPGVRLDEDEGRFVVTGLPVHKYAFKTSTLRNIALTAPYMHNGVFKTLEEVVNFYNNGGGKGLQIAPENQTLPFDKLHLTATEMQQIISFLRALSNIE